MLPPSSRRSARGYAPGPLTQSDGPSNRWVHLPLWLLMGLLVVLSVVAVGLLAFLPVYFRSEAAMGRVAAKYRELSFLAVENNVVNLPAAAAAGDGPAPGEGPGHLPTRYKS